MEVKIPSRKQPTATPTPAAWLAQAAESRPAAEAIRWDGGRLDFFGLHAQSEALAGGLAGHIPQGATLVIVSRSRRRTALALYAGFRLGVAWTPVRPVR